MIDDSPVFLFHHTPPLEFGGEPELLLATLEGKVEKTSLEALSGRRSSIVTHSFSLLVDWFRHNALPLPSKIVDLEVAKKLIVGRPKSDFGRERPWDMASMMLDFVSQDYEMSQIRAALTAHMSRPPKNGTVDWTEAIASGLPRLWQATHEALKHKSEARRFVDVEVPAYNTMLAVQYHGFQVNICMRDEILSFVEEEYFEAHHRLAITHKIDVDRAFVDIGYLSGLLTQPLNAIESFEHPKEVIEARKTSDPICSLLHITQIARASKRILARTGNENGYCFPVYDTLGTVTGRILALDPHIQYLAKRHRKVIVPRTGRCLVYIDYSHFEPSIMANISKDAMLSNLCAEEDFYESLSLQLSASQTHRETIKTMFLTYSYGRTAHGLVDFLIGSNFTKDQAIEIVQKRFLPMFGAIETWRSTVEEQLLEEGRIGTVLGNYRYRTSEGGLNPSEKRWAVNQIIQGTGALILKRVIIKVHKEFSDVAIVLPMFDALLVEVPAALVEERSAELLKCFHQEFLEVCPFATPSARIKPFGV
jgi:hypothetical protein